MRTIWGQADHVEERAPGVVWCSTPSHGGFKVNTPALDKIPLEWRKASFNGQGLQGWFEEDCDWCMVALAFPELFTTEEQAAAKSTFNFWIAKKLEPSDVELEAAWRVAYPNDEI